MPKQQMLETPDSSSDPTCVNEGSQEALSRVGLLSASTLHDLRHPLGAIYAASEMLIQVDAGPTQVKRLATNIYRAAGRMRELLADLSSMARVYRPHPRVWELCAGIAAALGP